MVISILIVHFQKKKQKRRGFTSPTPVQPIHHQFPQFSWLERGLIFSYEHLPDAEWFSILDTSATQQILTHEIQGLIFQEVDNESLLILN
jgi:hypothetical protein